ncbi:hypothetical protein SLEP1_g7689 [Rubroshorea leprosula]|uniref:Bromo domain-containing protein n=1 Tax=Rubroshorea leprosula TaxID=152421 RepID=A0AAV5I964_9ROSI|nr:hypothetical protein SLEP1_g7689 [Rubroshorea leprosula]
MATEQQTTAQPWGTLEELLLACAVNRHGTKSWDTVAMELHNRRRSAVAWLTPQRCKEKFNDLKRRFMSQNDADSSSSSLVPLVDQLRRIRVEELRREVQRRDNSILLLELKVKRLEEEERERSLKEGADLGRETNLSPVIVAGNPAVDEDSGEGDDRSINESNSTSRKPEPMTATERNDGNDVVEADAGEKEEGKANVKTVPDVKKERDPIQPENEPTEGRVYYNDENKKQSSDVQSSVSLSTKKRRRKRVGGACGSSSVEEPERDKVSPANKGASAVKFEPLIKLLGIIRSHRLSSAFERRQRSQESQRYKTMIRQHIDLQTIQSSLDKGLYSDCTQKFFRDLLLLFNNIIIFYRKSSQEHIAAQELRNLVQKEMVKMLSASKPSQESVTVKPEPEKERPSLSKLTKSSTMVACGKRSSVKALSENASRKGERKEKGVEEKPKVTEKKVNNVSSVGIDEKGTRKKRSKEKPVTDQRKSRTSNKGGEVKHEYGDNELRSHDNLEPKMDAKKSMTKKKSVASFLKKKKQNSPSETVENDDKDGDSDDESKDGKEEVEEKKKGRGRKREVIIKREMVTRSSAGRGAREESGKRKRGIGRPSKRAAMPAESTAKRGREKEENGVRSSARKRSRR